MATLKGLEPSTSAVIERCRDGAGGAVSTGKGLEMTRDGWSEGEILGETFRQKNAALRLTDNPTTDVPHALNLAIGSY